jgi:hypothetical protein
MNETKKHPGGRPPLPPEKRLSEILKFRATAAEADAIYREAIRERKSLPEYLRGRLALVVSALRST